jgi:hypothetical protein
MIALLIFGVLAIGLPVLVAAASAYRARHEKEPSNAD